MNFGQFYGYPICCIEEFIEQKHMVRDQSQLLKDLENAGIYNSGFVPCEYHLRMLIAGTVSIQQLIRDRICDIPFPKGYGALEWFRKQGTVEKKLKRAARCLKRTRDGKLSEDL